MAGEAERLHNDTWRCTWPGCGYTHKMQSGVRVHYYAKHKRQALKGAPDEDDEGAPAARVNLHCGRPGCAGVYRVLRQSEPAEAAARADGWRLICPDCGRLSE